MSKIKTKMMSTLKLNGDHSHGRLYNWLFAFLVIIVLIVIYIIGDIIYHCNVNIKYLTEINGIITTLMTVVGVFIAFTAINVYSIFNSRVDEEKEKLNDLLLEYESRINSIDKDKVFDLQKELQIMLSINNIITNYISTTDKGTAIGVLLEEIKYLDSEIENSDSITNGNDLKGKLKKLLKTIHTALFQYYKNPKKEIKENSEYKRMFDDLMNKVSELSKKYEKI